MKKQAYLILELLQSFSRKDQKRFKQLVSSNFFNSDKKILDLLNLLLDQLKKGNLKAINLALLHNKLFNANLKSLNAQQKSLTYSKMSLLMSLAQQFITLQNLDNNPTFKTVLLQKGLISRKQYRLYEQFLKKEVKGLESAAKGIEFYQHKYFLGDSQLNYLQLKGVINKQNNLAEIKESLSLYYLFSQLDLYLLELSLAEFSSTHTIDHSYFGALKPLLQLTSIQSHPLVKVYLSVIDLLRKKTDETFFILIKVLDKYTSDIPRESLINFYNSAVNFCVLQLRKDKQTYNQHLFELYKMMDEKDLLFDEYQIHIGNLRNIINQSCRLEEYDWATEMLDKYYEAIPKNIRAAVRDFNLGTIAYYNKDYQLVIDYLFPLPTINLSYDINRRTIMIKAYYELDTDYKETTHTLFRSFEKYIREQKNLTSKSKTSYKNFIGTLINLYRIKHNATKMMLENVKKKLETQKLNSNKSWLLEKIEGLEKQ